MRLILPALLVLSLVCVAFVVAADDPRVGDAAPPIVLKTVEGGDFDLSKQTAKVVVLDFWATWCPPCRRGLPLLQKAADTLKADGVDAAVFTVNLQESPEKVRAFWESQKLTLPVLMDTDAAVAKAYDVSGIPTTVMIKGGKIVAVHVGLAPNMDTMIVEEVKKLAAE